MILCKRQEHAETIQNELFSVFPSLKNTLVMKNGLAGLRGGQFWLIFYAEKLTSHSGLKPS